MNSINPNDPDRVDGRKLRPGEHRASDDFLDPDVRDRIRQQAMLELDPDATTYQSPAEADPTAIEPDP